MRYQFVFYINFINQISSHICAVLIVSKCPGTTYGPVEYMLSNHENL